LSIDPRPAGDGYQGALDPDFRLDKCSDETLRAVMREFAVQTHLLMCSAEIALTEKYGNDRARDLVGDAWLATAWIASERLQLDVADTLARHPAIPPGFDRTVERDGTHVRCVLRPESAALLDPAQPGWIGALARGDRRGIEGIVRPVDPRADFDLHVSDEVIVDVHLAALGAPPEEPPVLAFMRIGSLSTFSFAT
jgi:hypothetical protein